MNKNEHISCQEILDKFKNQCSRSCTKQGECIEYIQLYLDNMACKNADKYFLDGTKNCIKCSDYYKINDCIKNNLKTKIENKICPDDLESLIKKQIAL